MVPSASRFVRVLLVLAALSTCSSFPTSPFGNFRRHCTTHLEAETTTKSRRRQLLVFLPSVVLGTWAWQRTGALAVASGPEVTDRIFMEVKAPTDVEPRRIVIGLYGTDAPSATTMLRQLVSPAGLASQCKPRDTSRTLQKEQLESNKVYNSCMENESMGVTYEYGTIWRIIKDERIDVGSVSGKFISREFPNWVDNNNLPLEFGSVSVQRGNESGFGFSIYPGKNVKSDPAGSVVVGKVIEGLDVIEDLNEFQVVKSSKVNYMALTGSDGMKSAPSRACRYGSGNLYCNEFKPLQKLSIIATGVL
jgi:cyclophilin family peptidyl-prolyl cis-trans isomerase